MNAVILAGGFGKRLMPLTENTPKPMLKVKNRPILDFCLSQLKAAQIDDVLLTLGYLPQRVVEWTRGYSFFNCRYAIEETPLGTFGGVKRAESILSDTFVVLSGDGLSDVDLSEMLAFHRLKKADVTIATAFSATPWLFGVVGAEDGYVREFYEKPQEYRGSNVNTGIYIVNKAALSLLPQGNFDFAKDFFPLLLSQGKIACYPHRGYWSDVGNIAAYFAANMYALKNPLPPPVLNKFRVKNGFYLAGNDIAAHTMSAGNLESCIIEENCIIESGVFLRDCVVLKGSRVKNSHRRCIITPGYVLDMDDYTLGYGANTSYAAQPRGILPV